MRGAKSVWEHGTRLALVLALAALATLPALRLWQDRRAERLDAALVEALSAEARTPGWTVSNLPPSADVADERADDACVREATRLAVAWVSRLDGARGGVRLAPWGEQTHALRVAAEALGRCAPGAGVGARATAARTLGQLAAHPPSLARSVRIELLAIERGLRRRYGSSDEHAHGLLAEWVGGVARRQSILAAWEALQAERQVLDERRSAGGVRAEPDADAVDDWARRWHALAVEHAPHLGELDDAARDLRRAHAARERLVALAGLLAEPRDSPRDAPTGGPSGEEAPAPGPDVSAVRL
jgi:hypothetical protein